MNLRVEDMKDKLKKVYKILSKDQNTLILSGTIFLLILTSAFLSIDILTQYVPINQKLTITNLEWTMNEEEEIPTKVEFRIRNEALTGIIVKEITIGIKNREYENYKNIEESIIEGIELPLTLEITERKSVIIVFNATEYIRAGENELQITFKFKGGNKQLLEEKEKYQIKVNPIELITINPLNGSWHSQNVIPAVNATGGFYRTPVLGKLYDANGTVITENFTPNQDTLNITNLEEKYGYKIVFAAEDYVEQRTEIEVFFGIDRILPTFELKVNETSMPYIEIYQGQSLNVSWEIEENKLAPIKNQEISFFGARKTVYLDHELDLTNKSIVIEKNVTEQLPSDLMTFQLKVTDMAENQQIKQFEVKIKDVTAPNVTNNNFEVMELRNNQAYRIEINATDTSSIKDYFILHVKSLNSSREYFIQKNDLPNSYYDKKQEKWNIYLNSYYFMNEYYGVIAYIFDDSTNNNYAKVNFTIKVENDLIGKSALFYSSFSNDSLFISLKNIGFYTLNITKVKVEWKNENCNEMNSIYSYDNEDYILTVGNYLNATEYNLSTNSSMIFGRNQTMLFRFTFNMQNNFTTENFGELTLHFYTEQYSWITVSYIVEKGKDQ